jgi:DNA-binding ferritin-like protein
MNKLPYEFAIKFAAISTVSLANTEEALKRATITKYHEAWSESYEDVKSVVEREIVLRKKVEKLKGLLLLTDESVSDEKVGDLQLKQWQSFVAAFPDEGERK